MRPDGFSLPWQHSMLHYRWMIQLYGSPNGLCSSITESKHIQAVKLPWHRSNKFNALGQMLTTNEQLDKLQASRAYYKSHGMLKNMLIDISNPSVNTMQSHEQLNEPSDEPDTLQSGGNSMEPEDDGILDGPMMLGRVELAISPRKCIFLLSNTLTYLYSYLL